MKRPLVLAITFSLLGSILANWLGPKALAWYFDPPVEMGFNCKPAVEWGMEKLQYLQLAGLVGGLVLGGLLALAFPGKGAKSSQFLQK